MKTFKISPATTSEPKQSPRKHTYLCRTSNYYFGVGVGGGWMRIPMIIRLSQPSLAGVGAEAELGKIALLLKDRIN